ncbi:VOC family protein [Pseudalkalibacillus salsuginis]|uniref:VOC family protein n=1 Tax=Pseudalkalibacillus salsuginis TaxID=2910972 RepID=UPI001F46A891|nr:VOC family protein [Pseudalkalibacillus salsuginis]MCF6410989.1 VOC family protein [Pseudalkalibacillus salsuginis]
MTIIGFNHITLNVNDLDESLHFYEGILGMKRVHLGNTDAYLESGSAWICLLEKKNLGSTEAKGPGVDHFAFSINEKDFYNAVALLKEKDILIVRGPIERGGGHVVNFLDPNGIEIELNTSDLKTRMKDWR